MNVFLNSTGLLEGTPCVSKAVSLGDFVYVSGQYGKGETIEEQTVFCCNELLNAIADFGLQMHHLVKFTVYLADLNDKDSFLNTFKNFLEAPFPACTILKADGLEGNSKICIEAFGINTLRYEQAQREHSCSHGCQNCEGDCHHS